MTKAKVQEREPGLYLGKEPASYHPADFLFTEFVDHALVLNPAKVGFGAARLSLVKNWGMLGNDNYGDCVFAGSAHEHELWTLLGGHEVEFSTESVLGDYSAVTGFDPNDPSTDQGTDMHVAMSYRRKTGIADAAGTRHKIGGYCSLEPGNYTQLLQALSIFDAVAIGIEVPTSAMDQFRAGKPWSVVARTSIEGGHYIPCVARPGQLMLDVVTWGKVQGMTQGFYHKYCDEVYGLFSVETLQNGKSPEGFSLADFKNAVQTL